MPFPFWYHVCGEGGVYTTGPVCESCGAQGTFAGWKLSVDQDMGRYQYVYGLKPMGPHRQVADERLGALRVTCTRCEGQGILTIDGGRRWRICPVCEGTGGFWTVPDEDVQRAREEVLVTYPDAGARPLPGFLNVVLVRDLAHGDMIAAATEVPIQRLHEGR